MIRECMMSPLVLPHFQGHQRCYKVTPPLYIAVTLNQDIAIMELYHSFRSRADMQKDNFH